MTYLQTWLPCKPVNIRNLYINQTFYKTKFCYEFFLVIIIHYYNGRSYLFNKLETRLNKYFLDKYCYVAVLNEILLVAIFSNKEIDERNNVYNKCKLGILILSQVVSIFIRIITKSTNNVNLIAPQIPLI